jgi:hypothetical protein
VVACDRLEDSQLIELHGRGSPNRSFPKRDPMLGLTYKKSQ